MSEKCLKTLPLYVVRIVTGTGENIDVPCTSQDDATEVLDAAEREGYRARLIRQPSRRLTIIRHLSVENYQWPQH